MRKKEILARTLTLKVRYADFQMITRSKTQDTPLQTAQAMLAVLPELLKKTEVGQRPIRLIGINLSNLIDATNPTVTSTIVSQADETVQQVCESPQLGLF